MFSANVADSNFVNASADSDNKSLKSEFRQFSGNVSHGLGHIGSYNKYLQGYVYIV